jgi:hypothetical protein
LTDTERTHRRLSAEKMSFPFGDKRAERELYELPTVKKDDKNFRKRRLDQSHFSNYISALGDLIYSNNKSVSTQRNWKK